MSPTGRREFLRAVAGATTGTLAAGITPATAAASAAYWPYNVAWRHTYGERETLLNAATETSDGYLAVGRTDAADGEWRAWLCAVDRDGAVRWRTSRSEGWSSSALAVAPAADGDVVVAGQSRARRQTSQDAWLRRVAPDGTVRWRRTYGGEGGDDTPTALVATDEGFLFAGTTRSQGSGAEGWLVAVDGTGAVQREQTYGDEGDQRVHDLTATDDGYLLVGATTPPSAAVPDAWLVRVARDGTRRWKQAYGGDGFDRMNAAVPTARGFLLAGMTSTPRGNWDVWLVAVDGAGTVRWRRTHGGETADDYATDLVATDGGYLVVGTTGGDDGGGLDKLLLGVDRRGRYRWHRIFGGPERDVGRAVVAADGGHLVAGRLTDPSSGQRRAWLTRLVEPTPTPTPGRSETTTLEGTPMETVGLPTAAPTIEPIDMDDAREGTTTSSGGPGLGVASALAALGLGAWLGWRRDDGE